MRWYRFGDSTSWMKNGPKSTDLWKAFVNDPKVNKHCFIYEDQTLIAVIDCTEWLNTSRGQREDHIRNLMRHLQTELDKTLINDTNS